MNVKPVTASSVEKDLGAYQKRRILILFFVVFILGVLISTTETAWEGQTFFGADIDELLELLGLSFIGIAVLGRMWATLYIGGRKSQVIVQDGPYSITRNPLYLFSVLGASGIGLLTESFILAATCGLVALAVFIPTAKYEEAYLEKVFGSSYTSYKNRVPLLLPRFSLYADTPTLEIQTARLYRTLRDGMVFFLAFPAFEFIETLHDAAIIPVLFYLY